VLATSISECWHGLYFSAVAIENNDQFFFLELAQCDEIQGYYIFRPLSLDDFRVFYKSNIDEGNSLELDCV
jgi:EAL domain-containing protein (putative c-di-GMP-specific phosphodiesterase class I)